MIGVRRSRQAPASLREKRSWRGEDVLERPHADFLGKCYLCERPVQPGSMEVDHRRPSGLFPEHKYDWRNLFPACRECNGARERGRFPEAGLLDPSDPADDVEGRLQQWIEDSEKADPRFAPRVSKDEAAGNTAAELDRIHNRDTMRCADLRDSILRQGTLALRKVLELKDLEQKGHTESEAYPRLRDTVRRMVSRRAPYTMLVRSLVAPYVSELFD